MKRCDIYMIILGFDPGIATVGFGVIQTEEHRQHLLACGTINTAAGLPLSTRLEQIYIDAQELIAKFRPEAIAIEELFFNTNITTGIAVAHGRGILLLAGQQAGVPMFEYTPLQVKQAVAGYGRAGKRQVIAMVTRILNMPAPPKPDDAADALAIALCHARARTSQLLLDRGRKNCSTT